MRVDIESHLESCSLSQIKILDELVEVVVVSTKSSIPVLQCRATKDIKVGALRLFPHAGDTVVENEMSLRKLIETRLDKLPDDYIKGVKVGAHVYRQHAGERSARSSRHQDFLFFRRSEIKVSWRTINPPELSTSATSHLSGRLC